MVTKKALATSNVSRQATKPAAIRTGTTDMTSPVTVIKTAVNLRPWRGRGQFRFPPSSVPQLQRQDHHHERQRDRARADQRPVRERGTVNEPAPDPGRAGEVGRKR